MDLILLLVVLGLSLGGGLLYLVGVSVLRGAIRQKAMARVETRHQSSVVDPTRRADPIARTRSGAGAGLGRVHLGLIAARDPAFSELDFIEAVGALYAQTLHASPDLPPELASRFSEGALHTLLAGPVARLQIGEVDIVRVTTIGAYADDVWHTAELELRARVQELDDPDIPFSYRLERWRLRRKGADGTWEVASIVESSRNPFIPPPPLLLLGPAQPPIRAAAGVEAQWTALSDEDQDQVRALAEAQVRALLDGESPGLAPLQRALRFDASLLAAQGLARRVTLDRLEVLHPLRQNDDATHQLLELELLVRHKTWTPPESEPTGFTRQPLVVLLARPRAGGEWGMLDLRWIQTEDG